MRIELIADLPLEGFRRKDTFDSRDFSISEDFMNYYIHGINVDTGFSQCNYLTIPKFAAKVVE